MIRVLVTNAKGGCGKTTLATNLAAAFACGGLKAALADVDRQKSSLDWLAARPDGAAPVVGLDWRKGAGDVPRGVQRLVIDAPAALSANDAEGLVRAADIVLVPVLPSVFDEGSTRRFLARLEDLKPVRKGRKAVALVANRVRPRSRAGQRLESFLAETTLPLAARLADRSAYPDLARRGLGVFDPEAGRQPAARAEWQPLLGVIEAMA